MYTESVSSEFFTKFNNNNNNNNNNKVQTILSIVSTHQPMYWRMTISSCTGTAAYLRTKQYLLTDLI
jgi:hypothetical protein